MTSPFDKTSVYAGSLANAARHQRPEIRLCGATDRLLALWIARGPVEAILDGQVHILHAGTGVIISAGTPRQIEAMPGSFGSVISMPSGGGFAPQAPVTFAKVLNITEQTRVGGLVENVRREETTQAEFGAAARFHLANYFLINLARLAETAKPRTPAQDLMSRFANLAERDFMKGHSLRHYAEVLDVTQAHLTETCQTLNHRSAAQFLQDRTLAEARVLLATTQQPVEAIADNLGFSGTDQLSRIFTERLGRSPSDYRLAFAVKPPADPIELRAAE